MSAHDYAVALTTGAEQAAQLMGVTMWTDVEEIDGTIYVHVCNLGRDTSNPATKGNGMKALGTLVAAADANGWVVDIDHMRDEPRLGELYGSLGFTDYNPEDTTSEIVNMRRQPVVH